MRLNLFLPKSRTVTGFDTARRMGNLLPMPFLGTHSEGATSCPSCRSNWEIVIARPSKMAAAISTLRPPKALRLLRFARNDILTFFVTT